MKEFETSNIRNVALAGHDGSGKTSLAEAILYSLKVTERLGTVNEGTALSDYDPEEIRRKHSIGTALLPVEQAGVKINLLDLPGRRDFVGEIKNSMRVADGVVIVIDAHIGVEVGTEFVWEYADEFGIAARAVFINKLDREQADFDKALQSISNAFGRRTVAITLPVGKEASFKGVVDLIKMKFVDESDRKVNFTDIPADLADAAKEARSKLVEAAAEGDDELMMKFLDDQPLTDEEIMKGLREGVLEGRFLPVCCGSASTLKGMASLLNLTVSSFPNPLEGPGIEAATGAAAEDGAKATEKVKVAPQGQTLLYIFKTVSDPYAGHLSFFKVMHGKLQSETSLTNMNRNKSERVAHVLAITGKKHENIHAMAAGDLGAVGKLDSTHTCDTLSADGNTKVLFMPTPLPPPTVRMAVVPKVKADEEKIGLGFRRLTDQDPTLHLARDPEIRQTIVSGMGDSHLDVAVHHLKEISKVEVELQIPKVPYRETITKKAEGQGKYKKQSGGRGQFGDCWIKFEPLAGGDGFEFEWGVVGGVIPTKFEPSVEKGLIEALEHGVLSGNPTVGVKATCYDGSYHAVDSSEMAFKVAASLAFKSIIPKANPVILEPIYRVKITVPEQYMGDIMGDINGRRGRVQGVSAVPKKQIIEALVPLSEMFTYSRDMRSMTRGSGVYELSFDHYERVPGEVQEKIIAESHVEKEKEE